MRALVVYESMFGNTREVAAAVAEGLQRHLDADLVEVSQAPAEVHDDISLLVVGGPTHAFGLSRPRTRQSVADQATGEVTPGRIGLREWIAGLGDGRGRPAATFDTRIRKKPPVPGSAARKAGRQLHRRGYELLTRAADFWVTGTSGPLVDGERDRARQWGERLAQELRNRKPTGAS